MAGFLYDRRSIFAAPALITSNRSRVRAEPSRGLHLVGTRARSLLAPSMGGGTPDLSGATILIVRNGQFVLAPISALKS